VQRKKEIGCARSDKGPRPAAPRSRSHEAAQNLRKESDALLALLGEVITAYVVAVEYFVDEIAALRRRIFFSNGREDAVDRHIFWSIAQHINTSSTYSVGWFVRHETLPFAEANSFNAQTSF